MTSEWRIRHVIERYFGAALTDEDIAAFDTRLLHGGEWLFHQGARGDALYLLARGRLQAWLEIDDDARLLGEIAPGDSVGEMGLLSGQPRSAGVKAVRDSLLVRIDQKQFDALAQAHPEWVTRLAANVVNMTRNPASGTSRYRPPRTVAIVPLDDSPEAAVIAERLAPELQRLTRAAKLLPQDFLASAASRDGTTADDLGEWLHEQEDAHELVVFDHAHGDARWNEMTRRQADLVLFVADGRVPPGQGVAGRIRNDDGAQHALVLIQDEAAEPIRGTGRWLDACPADFHLHLRSGESGDLARLARVLSGQAVGLVLSAGAARGFAHIGVHRAMRELGIPVDWIGGSSIGSIMGAAMAAGWDLERIERTARQCFVEGKPFSDFTVPVTSLIRGRRMTRLLESHLDYRIEDLPIPFFCVSSVLDDGSLNLHRRGGLSRALCASAALPGVIPPAVVNRRLAIDGSVLNSLPVDLMQTMPVGQIIAVDLSSQKSYEVAYDRVPPPWRVLAGRYLPFVKRQRVPPLATIMLKATEIGTLGRMRELGKRADVLLQPDVRGFGITEVRTFDRIVEAGYRCAIESLTQWRSRAHEQGQLTPTPR